MKVRAKTFRNDFRIEATADEVLGSQGGLVVINRASHLCDPGSTLASGRMWAEFQSISI